MKLTHILGCGLGASTLLFSPNAQAQTKADRPNIIYVLADDMGYADLGCFGQRKIETPHIDRMAKEGMIFTNHYAGTAVCAPSRCSLLTGLHTGHTNIRGNKAHQPEGQYPISAATKTVAECMQEAGYKTALVGKWGLGYPGSEVDPMNQGFDHFYGYNCQRQAHTHYPDYLWQNRERITIPENENGKREIHSHELLTKDALHFIEENKEQPFFLYLSYIVPHAELAAPEEYMKQYRGKFSETAFKGGHYYKQENPKAAYAAMVSMMDADVGKIRTRLKELGIDKNTLVIFTSDNGPHAAGGNDPDFFDSNGKFRGYKRDLYEGGIRSPFVACWPGKIKAGSSSEHISAFWDFMPTACELAGVDTPKELDGISYLPALLGQEQAEHDYLYWEFHEKAGKQAIRKGKWKALRLGVKKDKNAAIQLFDLSVDPGEEQNVADQYPKVVKEMKHLFANSRTPVDAFPFGDQ
eukprot:TRINITY_DN225168_c0_g2_i1.p2 TRINITY_DN225168_c0_g2~~TRINITY_DN225168_c0_g2_i1.p2  ORF type:complete len:467 (+),score=7.39 TRINITY_DN225168_c0_g2_i1:103-1503(+)